jgi:hypothetical protein
MGPACRTLSQQLRDAGTWAQRSVCLLPEREHSVLPFQPVPPLIRRLTLTALPLHYDYLPFTVRFASCQDADALQHLQSFSLPHCQRRALSAEEIGSLLSAHPQLPQYVCAVGTVVIAGLLFQECGLPPELGGRLVEVQLAAAHPGLLEHAPMLHALW